MLFQKRSSSSLTPSEGKTYEWGTTGLPPAMVNRYEIEIKFTHHVPLSLARSTSVNFSDFRFFFFDQPLINTNLAKVIKKEQVFCCKKIYVSISSVCASERWQMSVGGKEMWNKFESIALIGGNVDHTLTHIHTGSLDLACTGEHRCICVISWCYN